MRILLRILGYTRRYAWAVVLAYVGLLGMTALSILVPRILEDVVDIGIDNGDASFMLQAGLAVVGLGLLRGIAGFVTRYFSEWLSNKAAYDMRNQLYDHVLHLSFSYHDTAQTGQLITRAISDVDEVKNYLAYGLVDGLNTISLTVGVSLIMLATHFWLGLVGLLPLIPLLLLGMRFGGLVRTRFRKVMDRLSTLGEILEENLVGLHVVRAFARERHEMTRFSAANNVLYGQRLSLINTWVTYMPLLNMITGLSTILVLWFGGLLVSDPTSGVTVGTVVAFNAYVLMLSQPLRFFGFVIMLTTQAIASGERVFEVLDASIDVGYRADASPTPPLRGAVTFDHVTFRYREAAPPVLQDITLDVQPGQIVALLGATGSGKSTLVNLIPRFYDVSEGCLLIDGQDVRDLELTSLRRQIGVVLQESLLFSATIRENIALGRPDVSQEEIEAAAKAANAHGFITGFPEGYDTIVGERGVTLSGGQRQRIAIARALVLNPRILILDDSTSSVDTQTEHEIQEALARLMEGRTTFIIAQRLTSVQRADLILVLDNGRIAEQGTHRDLLALDGLYRDIYRLQLEDQERVRRELLVMGGLTEAA
ncbi:MAG: ABC transporter ATP-binding protein [Anaerolineae bacterium]|nr:ABC transporter ATP-binding protein [Anaerolineae bacterium]